MAPRAAFDACDLDAIMALYWKSPELVSVTPGSGPLHGWDAVTADYVEAIAAMGDTPLELIGVTNRVEGSVVIGVGTWRMKGTTDGKNWESVGRYTDVKAMRGGKLVYVVDQASVGMPPPQ